MEYHRLTMDRKATKPAQKLKIPQRVATISFSSLLRRCKKSKSNWHAGKE